jgi:aspartate/methionine/tyrosine aminotransferase
MQSVQAPIIPIIGKLIASTPGTISLGQGVVSWGPPREALEAVARFPSDPELHKYGPVEGQDDLVEAITQKLAGENGIEVAPHSQVFVTAGGNMAFLNAILAVCDDGDEVILQAPYYFNHEMAVVIAGARPVPVDTDPRYQPDPDRISAAITPRTRAVVTISPNNPSGAVYGADTLIAINDLCAKHGLLHVHDEVYEYFTYDGRRHVSPGARPGAGAHTATLYSLSKTYGFASWRIGYMVAPRALAEAINKIQDTNLICAPLVSQAAALAALRVGRAYCERWLPRLDAVRRLVATSLSQAPGTYELGPLDGAFYGLLRVHTTLPPLALVERLVREHRVAAIPGTTFGLRGCTLRISYGALEPGTVEVGIRRLVEGLSAVLS